MALEQFLTWTVGPFVYHGVSRKAPACKCQRMTPARKFFGTDLQLVAHSHVNCLTFKSAPCGHSSAESGLWAFYIIVTHAPQKLTWQLIRYFARGIVTSQKKKTQNTGTWICP